MYDYKTFKRITTEFQETALVEYVPDGSKQTYLAWIDQWRVTYKRLSQMIRQLRACRKPYLYEYVLDHKQPAQFRGNDGNMHVGRGVYRANRIGENPNWSPDADWMAATLSEFANVMCENRRTAKEIARAEMLKVRDQKAA